MKGEDSFVKYAVNCFSLIRVSAAEETAACMYIHYHGLGTRGELMCFTSVSDYQNKVYIVLATVPTGPQGCSYLLDHSAGI